MPCTDPVADAEYTREYSRKCQFYEAALCAVMSALEQYLLREGVRVDMVLDDWVDWKEAGLDKKHFTVWWKAHQKKDQARRKAEAVAKEAKAKENKLKASAVQKLAAAGLTKEELAVLEKLQK